MPEVDPLVQLKVTSAVCSFFSILTTAGRLYLRRAKFWWDDAFAFLATIFLLVQIIAVFMHLPDPHVLSWTSRVATYYVMAVAFYLIIWTARLSILFSIIRIDPNPYMRTILNRVAIVFIVAMIVMCAQLFWVCEPMATWKNEKSPQCPLTKQVAICQLVTDILADMLLIIAPLRLLQQLSAHDGTRRRLMIIFSTSVVTTIVSLVHAAFILTIGGIRVVIAAIIEDTFSLIVCNVPVVVTFLLRRAFAFGSGSGSEGQDDTDEQAASTFQWWRSNTSAFTTGFERSRITVLRTVESDTADEVPTFNLWELQTKGGESTKDTSRKSGAIASGLDGSSVEARSLYKEDDGLRDGEKGKRSVAWLEPGTFPGKGRKVRGDGDETSMSGE